MANPIVYGYTSTDYYWTGIANNESVQSMCNNEIDTKKDDYINSINNPNSECYKNKSLAQNLTQKQTSLSAAQSKYEDTKMLYNRELIFTLNLLVGLGALIYYIYINQDALPSLPSKIEMPSLSAMTGSTPVTSVAK
jgi:hypothetical protein